jgi:GntR family transcriptional regulator/MocR family aminotransferase
MPQAEVRGIAAGLHALALLPEGTDEAALAAEAFRRGVSVHPLGLCRSDPAAGRPGLVLGYANLMEPAIERGVAELAAAWGEVAAQR